MAVVSMMRFAGNPDDLAARMAEHVDPVAERLAAKHGALVSIVARDGDDGIIVINLWEHEEGRHTMAEEPEVQAAVQAAGLPAPAFTGHEVLSLRTTEKGRQLDSL
jgi:DNA-binding IclR family transcriptional regulator